ncbi:MAG: hypothetical protein JHC88_23320, partial [Niveispirillum sp.]|nr:hypothetical protein [Niveispirillum sp.]
MTQHTLTDPVPTLPAPTAAWRRYRPSGWTLVVLAIALGVISHVPGGLGVF